ncbi:MULTISPECIES: tyrosine-type recombinase/integrase [unclassified Gemella]|uniref:tyrosine-type recombinase/integrase n=1 Tax=unclassified Gemella TaxID=2624949 RepID=UPI0015CFEF20|nr:MULTISPECIES: tyrosine-type recombinase/integrase [unclassified Gemella]MBF0710582.1 site-specific integrase [Gemella sp. GL1.1]NYS27926.1 site-specific integrase [Gemella sp. GL1]
MIKQYTKNNKKLYMVNNLYLGVNPITGKEVRKSKRSFESKREAEIYIARLKIEFEKGTMFVSNKKHTFSDIYDLWIENYKHTVKESSYNLRLENSKVLLKHLGHMDIKKMHMLDLQRLFNELSLKYSKNYINTLKASAKMILDFAVNSNLINSNPIDKIKLPRVESINKSELDDYYTKEELIDFLNIVKENHNHKTYTIFRLLAFTGMRIGEALALEWSDIDFNNSSISINKTIARGTDNKLIIQTPKTKSSSRVIDIDPTTMQTLRQHKLEQKELIFRLGWQNKGIVFTNLKNTYLWNSNINSDLYRICKKHNFKSIKLHGFRHTHCSLLFESGASIQAVQTRLGHSDFKTTMNIYNHVTEKMKQETANKFAEYMSI